MIIINLKKLKICKIFMFTSNEKQKYDAIHFKRKAEIALQSIAISESLSSAYSDTWIKPIHRGDIVYDTKQMNAKYNNEKVLYFTLQGLEEYQVFYINGLIYKSDLTKYTSEESLNRIDGNGDMIVMDEIGNTFIHPKKREIIHHSSFFSGESVAFAALIICEDGVIKNLCVRSGHYSPDGNELFNFQSESTCRHTTCDQPEELIIYKSNTKTIADVKEKIWEQRIFFAYPEAGSILYNGRVLGNDFCIDKLNPMHGSIFWLKASGYPSGKHYYKKIKIEFMT